MSTIDNAHFSKCTVVQNLNVVNMHICTRRDCEMLKGCTCAHYRGKYANMRQLYASSSRSLLVTNTTLSTASPIGQQPLLGYSQGNVCSFHTGVVVGPCGDAAESNCSEPMVEAQS